MSPRILVATLVAAVMTTACSAPAPAPQHATPHAAGPRRPNIVVVLVDDMRWDDMRAAGHPFI